MGRDQRIIKSYVFYADECYFVSTINRDSSAMIEPNHRYNETIVWHYDWEKAERGVMIYMSHDMSGSIATHQRICEKLLRNGAAIFDSEEDHDL